MSHHSSLWQKTSLLDKYRNNNTNPKKQLVIAMEFWMIVRVI